MNEDMMNDFCTYLEEIGAINYTEVWVKGNHPELYGRTFTPQTKDRHRIEVYENEEHTNKDILCHELAHVMLYKVDGPQDHGDVFRKVEHEVHKLLKEYNKETETCAD